MGDRRRTNVAPVLLLVLLCASPLYAAPFLDGVFDKIFNKGGNSEATTTTSAPETRSRSNDDDYAIDFNLSTADAAPEPSFFDGIKSALRIGSAFVKSFVSVLTGKNNAEEERSFEDIANDQSFDDFDPFGVEPSDSEVDFFADLDYSSNTVNTGKSASTSSSSSTAAVAAKSLNSNTGTEVVADTKFSANIQESSRGRTLVFLI